MVSYVDFPVSSLTPLYTVCIYTYTPGASLMPSLAQSISSCERDSVAGDVFRNFPCIQKVLFPGVRSDHFCPAQREIKQ